MAPRILLYGQEGIGKSTFGATLPKPVFLPTEDGLGQIEADAFPLIDSFDAMMARLVDLYQEKHSYQTVVIDSLDALERLVFDAVCKHYSSQSIERVDGGYGKGYVHALGWWRQIRDGLAGLRRDRGMLVLLLAHAKVERFEDPESIAYDRYTPRLNRHAAAMFGEWCDAVLFASRKFRVQAEAGGFNRERGIAIAIGRDGGERILRCEGGPAAVAKNRYGLPAELPLSWPAVAEHLIRKASNGST